MQNTAYSGELHSGLTIYRLYRDVPKTGFKRRCVACGNLLAHNTSDACFLRECEYN